MKEDSQIQQLKREIERLKRLVYLDHLTNLYNRRGFLEISNNYFQSAVNKRRKRRKNEISKLAIIFLDIDDFKKINDKHGHRRGDKALKVLARILRENLRKLDIIGRWGGEEFVVLLVNVPKENAKKIAEKLQRKIANDKTLGFQLTVSAGLAFPRQGETLSQVIHRADKLMYQAKKQGKNMVIISK